MSSFINWINERWRSAVWSKVIANFLWEYVRPWIIPLIASACTYAWNKNTFLSIIEYQISFPVWVGLLAVLVVWLIILFVKYLTKKRSVVPRNIVWDSQIGNYTFEELHNKLSQKLRTRTSRMNNDGVAPPNTSMLVQFTEYQAKFAKGISGGEGLVIQALGEINMNDGGYITDVLAPKLTEYGLLTETKSIEKISGRTFSIVTYKISELGYEFLDCLEKVVSTDHSPAIYRAQ